MSVLSDWCPVFILNDLDLHKVYCIKYLWSTNSICSSNPNDAMIIG